MANEKLTERIGFRLTSEELRQIQRLAAPKGQSPDDWCREIVRRTLAVIRAQAQADRAGNEREGQAQFTEPITRAQIMQFQETIRARILLQEFLRHYIQGTLSPDAYRQLIEQINKPDGKIAELAEKYMIAYGVLKTKPTN
jgi:hypothetical protein